MSHHFQFVDPDDGGDTQTLVKRLAGDDDDRLDLCCDAVELLRSAGVFFRGVFPTQTVHCWWGDGVNLPWADAYWLPSAEEGVKLPKSIKREAEQMAGELLLSWDDQIYGGRDQPAWGVSFGDAAMIASSEILMKALAVEVMLCVDGFLVRQDQGNQAQSMRWLAAAYKGIIECTLQAQFILGNPSENARIAAQARHRENHDMKRQVFAWLDQNFTRFKSMDSAAEAIAGNVVPVKFRTARDWIGQWKRCPPSARTL